jgi:D-tagatose-1,6-bisphosphate aldolase subunit GatZ/KbaZ
VEDGFAFLKVGPALTFAMREALLGLSAIDAQISGRANNLLAAALVETMRKNDKYWKEYYPKDEPGHLLFSLSDRVRYYWDTQEITGVVERLFASLQGKDIAPGLISQYIPRIGGPHVAVTFDQLANPRALVMAAVDAELERYEHACFPSGEK